MHNLRCNQERTITPTLRIIDIPPGHAFCWCGQVFLMGKPASDGTVLAWAIWMAETQKFCLWQNVDEYLGEIELERNSNG